MKLIKEIESRRDKNSGHLRIWAEFLCEIFECGKIVERRLSAGLRQKSCGCVKIKGNKNALKHGGKGTKVYEVWHSMKQRILNSKNKAYKNYGGRGITLCNEWLEFIPFRDWALSNGYQEGLFIDRENPDGNYEPSNCRFLTIEESNRNKTTTITMEIANEIRTLWNTGNYTQQELAEKYNVPQGNISLIVNNKIWKNM